MDPFTIHTRETAPEASRPLIERAEATMGFLPNLMGVMAESAPVLEAYLVLSTLGKQTSLSPVEAQVVYQVLNFENDCHYCMAAHSLMSEKAGMAPEVLDALREGTPLPDPKLEALAAFTRVMHETRGWPGEGDLAALEAAGYDRRTVLDVVLMMSTKVLSNVINHVAGTPVDAAFAGHAWEKPGARSAAE